MYINKVFPYLQTKYEHVLTNSSQKALKTVECFYLKCLPVLFVFAYSFCTVINFL